MRNNIVWQLIIGQVFVVFLIFVGVAIFQTQEEVPCTCHLSTATVPPQFSANASEYGPDLPFGVNIWGAGMNEVFGLVESTTGIMKSLDAAGIPYVLNDVQYIPGKSTFRPENPLKQIIKHPPQSPYFFNLWSHSFVLAPKNLQKFPAHLAGMYVFSYVFVHVCMYVHALRVCICMYAYDIDL